MSRQPRTIGNFTLTKPIGRGTGGATIYAARHSILKANFAVKLFEKTVDREVNFRIRDEVSLLSSLWHQNICRIYEVFESEYLFGYSMRLYRTSLDSYINDNIFGRIRRRIIEFPFEKRIVVLSNIIDGLSYIHSRGIAHRDLCPKNILIDDDGVAAVADFGLAKSMDTRINFTVRKGSELGNPKIYGAPEQDSGLEHCDVQTDVYSFALVAYQLLTGVIPKGSPLPHARDENPSIPVAISDILLRCLNRDMDSRPSSAEVARVFKQPSSDAILDPQSALEFPLPAGVRPFFGGGRLHASPLYVDEASLILQQAPARFEYMGVALKLLTIPEFFEWFSRLRKADIMLLDPESKAGIQETAKALRLPIARIRDNLVQSNSLLKRLRDLMGARLTIRRLAGLPPFRFSLLDRRLAYVRNYQSRASGFQAPIWEAEDGPFLEGIVRMRQHYWNNARPEV